MSTHIIGSTSLSGWMLQPGFGGTRCMTSAAAEAVGLQRQDDSSELQAVWAADWQRKAAEETAGW
eukprot:5732263-Amphidinium_carterae.1